MRWKWKFPHLIPCFHACHASEVFLNKHRYQWAARKGFRQGQGIRVQSSQAARLGKWEERDGHWERCPCSPTASWREARATLRSCHCPRVSLFQDIISFCYFQWKLMKYFQSINNWAFTNKEEKKELKPRISTSLCKFIWFSQKKTLSLFGFGSPLHRLVSVSRSLGSWRNSVPSHMCPSHTLKAIVLTILSLHTTNFKTMFSLIIYLKLLHGWKKKQKQHYLSA